MKYINSELITDDVIRQVEDIELNEVKQKSPSHVSDEFATLETVSELHFERIDTENFYKLFDTYNIYSDTEGLECRGVDVSENIAERAERFRHLPSSEREMIEKAILQYANDNEEEVLLAMRLTGREADRTFADELEQKYGLNTDKVRIATELFSSTYAIWEVSDLLDTPAYEFDTENAQYAAITEKLKQIDESANFLEHFQLPATHVTSKHAGDLIEAGQLLRKSDSSDNPWHFLGDGVYAGIFGCYKDWNGYLNKEMFEFRVPLADTVPLITHFNRPRSQVNLLGEGLDIMDRDTMIATAVGIQQWRHRGDDYRVIDDLKLNLLASVLDAPVEIYTDSDGIETIVADTDKEPIHWAMACRALRIPRFIPKSELSKSDIVYKPNQEWVEKIHEDDSPELLSRAEGLAIIGNLTESMRSKDLDSVMNLVEKLEKKSCSVFIDPYTADEFDEANGRYTFTSGWSRGHNWDNYFGGGLELDALENDASSLSKITLDVPLRNMFIIGDNHRDQYDAYVSRPEKAIVVLPVDTLSINLLEHGKGTVDTNGTQESSVIWRMAQQGDYSNNCFISEEQEQTLKEVLGYDVRVERNVITPDFINGEYDRLVIPRSVSVLKVSSIAYTLGLMEVVYSDQVEDLNMLADGEQRARLAQYQEVIANRVEVSPDVEDLVTQIEKNGNLTELDKFLAKVYFVLETPEYEVKDFLTERALLIEKLGGNFPESSTLNEMTPRREWFIRESSAHGTPHTLRVMLNMELLARLAAENQPEGENVNLRALEIATMLHDTRRQTDDYDDYEHGARASDFMETLLDSQYADLFKEADLVLATRIMTEHSLDDYPEMTLEEKLFKDADALDRYRFGRGPDPDYLRTPEAAQIDNSAKQMAYLSKFLLQNGYTRSESAITAGRVLGLLKN